jgi:hypothetical protein
MIRKSGSRFSEKIMRKKQRASLSGHSRQGDEEGQIALFYPGDIDILITPGY